MADGLYWNVAVIAATVMGPILAVQAQRFVDLAREKRNRRVTIFRTLMATRAASLSPDHVEALNAIPIEFYGNSRTFKEVVEAWRILLDQLGKEQTNMDLWVQRRQTLFVDLLVKLSAAVGYEFSRLELEREVYSPIGHSIVEGEQEVIRKGLSRLFAGESPLPLDIKSIPVDPDVLAKQKLLQDLLESVLKGETPIVVKGALTGERSAVD
ncbi:DUF6680 family protein [Rhizobium ruizarguesonis]|uniref:DUF6680 family protein n=1 Tax=Rhizobium ruizarguesonis TaxID=2081791 RepID=UPI0010311F49|nr:DUF6680 family protein [Rhizobium ruizarguesonis]TBE66417.1 hypothetical protein ELH00_10690 [Rhizobium ruizarguesonis]